MDSSTEYDDPEIKGKVFSWDVPITHKLFQLNEVHRKDISFHVYCNFLNFIYRRVAT